jgi:hypothetical protein
MLTIYCIGDSHADFFRYVLHCESEHCGSTLAYNLVNKEDIYERISKYLPKGSILLLCFGEIDIRVHVEKYNNIKECVSRYIMAICKFRDLGYKPIVFGPIASTIKGQKLTGEFPIVGTCKERNIKTSEFTIELQKRCEESNLAFLTIFDKLIDAEGLTKSEYYHDDIHLSRKAVPLVEPFLLDIARKLK